MPPVNTLFGDGVARAITRLGIELPSGGAPDLFNADPEPSPQQNPENRTFRVSDTSRDFVHARAAGLEKMDRSLHAQTLEIRQRRLSEHHLHVSGKRSLARPDGTRGLVQRKPVLETRARPGF